jgi:PPOX class probable F420-dependent enzyme
LSEQQNRQPEAEPKAGRPNFGGGYGVDTGSTAGMMQWSEVRDRVAKAHNYWVATTRPDGRPHTMPVWGIWLDEAFFFATDRASRKGRNLAINPACVVHLESGDEVAILEGIAEEVTDAALLARFADAYDAKYQYRPEPGSPGQVVYRLRPRVALAWLERDFPKSATRWEFDEGGRAT